MSCVKTQSLKLQLGSTASPQTFSDIANVTGISGLGGGSATEIDCTNFGSSAREFVRGFKDEGSITVNVNFDPDNATHVDLESLYNSGTEREWRILLGNANAAYWEFDAYVSSFTKDFALDDVVRGTLTLRVTGTTDLVP